MKKILLVLAFGFTMILSTGCSSSSSNSTDGVSTSKESVLVKGTPFTVTKGDTLVKITDDANVTVAADIETGVTTLTLVKGEAKVVHK